MINLLTSDINNPETIKGIRQIIFDTIQLKLRHEDYARTKEVFEKSFAYSSGKGLDKYLKAFQRRENTVMFDERVSITKHILPAVINNLDFLLNKTLRSPAVKTNYKNSTEAKDKNLKEIEGQYYEKENVKSYFEKYQRMMDRSDPNAWLINEFQSTDGKELAKVYPFIANALEAINFQFINGLLNYLIVNLGNDFTIYSPNQNIKLVFIAEAPKDSTVNSWLYSKLVNDYDTIVLNDIEYVRLDSKVYQINTPLPHNIGFVQARRFGFNFDMVTVGRTYVPFWWDAECYLSKIIKINSELDITMCRHNFPQKIAYVPRCTNQGCYNGWMPDNKPCSICHGTGTIVHTSALDVQEIALPKTKEEMIPLTDLITYIYPPVDGMKFTNEKIQELVIDCKEAVFNSTAYTKKYFDKTLGAKDRDIESVYDTLHPFAVNYTKNWKFVIQCISKITDTFEGLIIVAYVEKDFKFKTKEELIAELSQAKAAGASNEILRVLRDELMEVIFLDTPSKLLKYRIIDKYNPFSGKDETEIMYLMATNNVPQKKKILYGNMGWMFDEIVRETSNFYELEETKQVELIDKKLEEIIALLPEAPVLDLNIENA